jgi:salicylate 5-hydroxylase small subunit
VSAAERYLKLNARELRLELEELYADYAGCLNEERFDDWPGFFTDTCIYKIIPRENVERDLPLATWLCESKGYLEDRVTAIRKTMTYAPRYMRRMLSGIRVLGWEGEVLRVSVSYVALETLRDEITRVFSTGEHRDRIVVADGRLKFCEKLVVFDSELVPNSLIYPL